MLRRLAASRYISIFVVARAFLRLERSPSATASNSVKLLHSLMTMVRIVLFLSLAFPAAAAAAAASASCAGTTSPLCGSSCCCSAEDDLKLREAFLGEVKAQSCEDDAACRSHLKAYICAVCLAAAVPAPAHNDPPSALPLRCAGAVSPPPSISTTRHDDDLGSGSRTSDSSTLCVQQASTQAYDGVVPLHDGSGRLLCWRRNGQIWLATVDGSVLRVGDKPVVDLGNRVSQDAAARGGGLAGVAVHSSGRLYVSYYTTTDGRPDGGSAFLVVEQVPTATWRRHEGHQNRPNPAQATNTTRVFSMEADAEPRGFHLDYYGGQILFRPSNADSFLYLVTGPAQSDGQLQAKILRFRVGDLPSGNGTVTPMDAQVYTSVSGILRRCTFDVDRAQDLYCAIVKDDEELVYLISDPDASSYSATPPSPLLLVAHHRPTSGTPLSLVGGVLYRGYADATLVDSYIYMDSSQFSVMVVSPAHNSSTTRNLQVTCSASATSTCHGGDFVGGRVISFGEDEGNNTLLLATDGVYQVVGPTLCLAAIHTKTPMSTTRILEWVFGVIGTLTTLAGGYGAYKKCKCCNKKKTEIHVSATNGDVNIFNTKDDIELSHMGVDN